MQKRGGDRDDGVAAGDEVREPTHAVLARRAEEGEGTDAEHTGTTTLIVHQQMPKYSRLQCESNSGASKSQKGKSDIHTTTPRLANFIRCDAQGI